MAAAHENILFDEPMTELIKKPRRAIRKLAPDQSLAKPREFTPEEAKEIAEKGYHAILKEGLPRAYAERYRRETTELLTKPLGW
jgi:hypothetical protein